MRKLFAIPMLAVFAGSAVWASVTFTPPDTSQVKMATVVLKGQKAAPKASGSASLLCNPDETKGVFTIQARGLAPKKVYTVWLVSMVKVKGKKMPEMKMEGAGKPPFTLPVDAKGNAKLVWELSDCHQVLKWQTLEIVEHPSKNPKDMKRMVPVLMGDIKKMKD